MMEGDKKLRAQVESLKEDLALYKEEKDDASRLASEYVGILENLNEGIFKLDKKGTIIYLTGICENIFGRSRMALFGKRLVDLSEKESQPLLRFIIKKTFSGKNASNVEFKIVNKEEERTLSMNTSPVKEAGKIVGMYGVVRDITEEKKVRDALRHSQHELKMRVKELQKFTNVAVGRELRIVALKKEIRELKKNG